MIYTINIGLFLIGMILIGITKLVLCLQNMLVRIKTMERNAEWLTEKHYRHTHIGRVPPMGESYSNDN